MVSVYQPIVYSKNCDKFILILFIWQYVAKRIWNQSGLAVHKDNKTFN